MSIEKDNDGAKPKSQMNEGLEGLSGAFASDGNTAQDNAANIRSGVGGFLGIQLNTGADLSIAFSDVYAESLEKIAPVLKKKGIKATLKLIPSSKNGGQDMAFDTIVLMLGKDDITVAASVMLSTSRDVTTFDPHIIGGPEQYRIDKRPSEAYDQVFVNIVKRAISEEGYSSENPIIKEPRIIYQTFDPSEENLQAEFNKSLSVAANFLLDATGDIQDITLNTLRGQEIKLNVMVPPAGQMILDENDIPIAASMMASLTIGSGRPAKRGVSMNTGDENYNLGTISARVATVYVGPLQQPGMVMQQQNQSLKSFMPQVIIENMELSEQSIGRSFLAIIASTGFLDPNIIKKMYVPEALGVLNINTNVTGAEKPKPISPKDMRAKFDQYYSMMMRDEAIFSIVLKPGTTSFSFLSALQAASSNMNANEYLHNELDKFTNGHFSKIVDKTVPFVVSTDNYLLGTYPDSDGNQRPLAELNDLLYIMNKVPGQSDVITKFMQATSKGMDPLQSLALKKEVLDLVTQNRATYLDNQTVANINPQIISAFRTAIQQAGISIGINSDQFASGLTNEWAKYMAAGYGYDVNAANAFTGFQSASPFAANAAAFGGSFWG